MSGLPAEKKAALRPVFEAGCARGTPDACAGTALFSQSPEQIERVLQKACEDGSSGGCALLYEERFNATSEAPARAAALTSARRDCDRLGGSVCFSAASFLEHLSPNSMTAPAEARGLLERACTTGSSYGCYILGMRLDEGGDAARARPLYESACSDEVGGACYNLAHQLMAGRGSGADPQRAAELFERACSFGDASGCDYTAQSARNAQPSPENERVLRRACERGGAESCTWLAMRLGTTAQEQGKLELMEEAISLFERGCGRGSSSACKLLGRVAQDSLKGCEGGNPQLCMVAGYVYLRGISVPILNGSSVQADPGKAKEAFRVACTSGLSAACGR